MKKLEVLEKSFDENSDNKLELAACGSMLNVASDDGTVPSLNLILFIIVLGLGKMSPPPIFQNALLPLVTEDIFTETNFHYC